MENQEKFSGQFDLRKRGADVGTFSPAPPFRPNHGVALYALFQKKINLKAYKFAVEKIRGLAKFILSGLGYFHAHRIHPCRRWDG
jgi:hypothetical protein